MYKHAKKIQLIVDKNRTSSLQRRIFVSLAHCVWPLPTSAKSYTVIWAAQVLLRINLYISIFQVADEFFFLSYC